MPRSSVTSLKTRTAPSAAPGAVVDRRRRVAHRVPLPSRPSSSAWPGDLDHPLLQAAGDRSASGWRGDLVDHPEDLGDGAADRRLRPPAGQPLGHRVEVVDRPFRVGAHDAVADRGEGHLGALLLAGERLLGLLALGDVDRDPDAAGDLARLAPQRLDAGLERMLAPDVLEAHRLAGERQVVGADGVRIAGAVVVEQAGSRGDAQAERGEAAPQAGIEAQLAVGGPDDRGDRLDQQPQARVEGVVQLRQLGGVGRGQRHPLVTVEGRVFVESRNVVRRKQHGSGREHLEVPPGDSDPHSKNRARVGGGDPISDQMSGSGIDSPYP